VTTGKVLTAEVVSSSALEKNNLRGRNTGDSEDQEGGPIAEIVGGGGPILGRNRVYRSGMGRDAVFE